MSRLTISSFAKCLKDALQPPDTNEAVIDLLFGWVVSKESVTDKKGNAVVISSKLVSELFNQKVDVPKAIKDYLSAPNSVDEAIAHMGNMVIPMINPVMLNDLIGKLAQIVDADESIPEEKKAELRSIKSECAPRLPGKCVSVCGCQTEHRGATRHNGWGHHSSQGNERLVPKVRKAFLQEG